MILAVLTAADFDLICMHYPEFYTRMRDIVDLRQKDSMSKGFSTSNTRKTIKVDINNAALKKFLSKKTDRNPQV